ncbi:MAG: hypothetical protein AAF191_16220 [Verrucomicrobiota bacterium]
MDTPAVDGSKSLLNIRLVLESDEEGGFLSPKLSPDNLQVMATRPGYQGVFLIPATGGPPRRVVDANAYGADWTDDGQIQLGDRGKKKRYRMDGTEVLSAAAAALPVDVFCQDDQVYSVPEGGTEPVAITDASDRFYDPHLCPKHKMIAFSGLQTGLYLARSSGSGNPIFLGPGQGLSWAPDSSFLVYARVTDDGHSEVESDLFLYETRSKKLFNLTSGSDLMIHNPSVSKDGKSVVFEADGALYLADLPS